MFLILKNEASIWLRCTALVFTLSLYCSNQVSANGRGAGLLRRDQKGCWGRKRLTLVYLADLCNEPEPLFIKVARCATGQSFVCPPPHSHQGYCVFTKQKTVSERRRAQERWLHSSSYCWLKKGLQLMRKTGGCRYRTLGHSRCSSRKQVAENKLSHGRKLSFYKHKPMLAFAHIVIWSTWRITAGRKYAQTSTRVNW